MHVISMRQGKAQRRNH